MKKVLGFVGRIVLHGIVLGIIWLDLSYVMINEWAAIALTIAWIAGVRVMERVVTDGRRKDAKDFGVSVTSGDKDEKHGKARTAKVRSGKIFFAVLDVVIVLVMIVATQFSPYWNSSVFRKNLTWEENGSKVFSKKDALTDYEFMMKYLKKIHPLTHGGLPGEVETRAKEVREWIEGQEQIEGYVLARKLESILSLLGDGHTAVEEDYDVYHVMKYVYEHNKAGHVLIGINDVPFEEFLALHPDIDSYETVSYGVRMIKNRVSNLEGLKYLGIDISGEIKYNYLTEDGEAVTVTVTAGDFLGPEEYNAYVMSVTGDDLTAEEDRGFVYYDVDAEHDLAILTLTSCRCNQVYKDTVAKMFEEIREKGIQNVCVDLRSNGGGSSLVANEFIKYLDVDAYKEWGCELRVGPLLIPMGGRTVKNPKKSPVFTGNVYVLTGVRTYSSAMDFAMLIQDNGIGKLVGQPCGNLPGSCGQVTSFVLPKTGFYFQTSTTKWYRVDPSKNQEPLIPDLVCPEEKALEVLLDNL